MPAGHSCLFSAGRPVIYEFVTSEKGPRAVNVSLDLNRISLDIPEIEESAVTSWSATKGFGFLARDCNCSLFCSAKVFIQPVDFDSILGRRVRHQVLDKCGKTFATRAELV